MIEFASEVDRLLARLRVQEPRKSGTLVRLVGLRMEARGIMAPLGACCEVTDPSGHRVEAEVVGFNDQTLYLMPFTEPLGIGPGASVRAVSHSASVCLGNDLLGRVIDGRGNPLDGKPAPRCDTRLALQGRPINPMERGPITQVLDVGVKAINGLLTRGCGQRVGLVAGSGVGKSVLLGMMTRFTQADVVVIGLTGERGREVHAFIEESLGPQGLAKSVVALVPTLIERAGVGRHSYGSITAIYTVLAKGDDTHDPIVDLARASLDGQVMLPRQLADAAHYPAIDLNGSISRLMPSLLPADVLKRAKRMRRLWSLYQQSRDLIQVGAYVAGTDPELDQAIHLRPTLEGFLRQDMHEGMGLGQCMDTVRGIVGD